MRIPKFKGDMAVVFYVEQSAAGVAAVKPCPFRGHESLVAHCLLGGSALVKSKADSVHAAAPEHNLLGFHVQPAGCSLRIRKEMTALKIDPIAPDQKHISHISEGTVPKGQLSVHLVLAAPVTGQVEAVQQIDGTALDDRSPFGYGGILPQA